MNQKNAVFLFIVIIVAVIVAGGIFLYSQKVQKDISEVSQKPIEIKQKEIYKDEITGVQIAVPNGWLAVAQEKQSNSEKWESGICLFDPERKLDAEGGQEKCEISLWLGKKENMDFKDFIGLKSDIEKTGLTASINKSKNGKDFLQYESSWEGLMTFIKKDDLVVLEQTRFPRDEEVRRTYDDFLNSF